MTEAHHFYPVLFYFRFREPQYAVSRVALVTLDTVSLIKSTLDDGRHAWLKESVAVAQLWRGTMSMLTVLATAFLPQGLPEPGPELPDDVRERWGRRYSAAIVRLRQAGVRTIKDEAAGAEVYFALRARWDRYIVAFTHHMAYRMEEIDPIGSHPESTNERQAFEVRLRSAG